MREKAVEQCLLELAKARQAEEIAKQGLDAELKEVMRAEQARHVAIGKTFDVNTLAETNDWLVACGRRRDRAQHKLEQTRSQVVVAQGGVVSAKNDLKKIDLIFERIKSKERAVAERVEQRQNDELSAARLLNQRRRGEP